MMLTLVLIGIMALALLLVFQQMNKAKTAAAELRSESALQRERIEGSQKEIQRLRDSLSRKNNDLSQTKNLLKKKHKTHSKNQSDEGAEEASVAAALAVDVDAEKSELQAALRTLQNQLENTKADLLAEANQAMADKEAVLSEEITKLKAEVKKFRTEAEILQGKASSKQLLGGSPLDLESLEPGVLNELARLHRKAQQNERLHSAAQGKIKMGQERLGELQRRYYAVCRELALAVGDKKEVTDDEARSAAEGVISNGAPVGAVTTPAPTPEAPPSAA